MSQSETLAAAAEFAQEIRKSRFRAAAAPIADAEQASGFIRAASDPTATHNCWAWRFGGEYRSSDDGEPGGSAGRPILAAIDGQGLDRVVVVVTRWFGGVKLGVGGLVRAYGGSAAECLRTAARVPLVASAVVAIDCDYATLALLYARLGEFAAVKLDERHHAAGATLDLRLPQANLEALADWLRDATRGRGRLLRLATDA